MPTIKVSEKNKAILDGYLASLIGYTKNPSTTMDDVITSLINLKEAQA